MSSPRSENLNNACRCCLSFDAEMINIFSLFESTSIAHKKQFTMYDLYRDCTQIVISDGELPVNICPKCCSRLKETFAFRNECLKSHYILQQMSTRTECKNKRKPAEWTNIKASFKENDLYTEEDECKQSNSDSIDSIDVTDDTLMQICSKENAKQASLKTSLRTMKQFGDMELTSRNRLSKSKKRLKKKCHKCITCGNEFSTARGLKIHIRLHTGERPEICNICKKAFSDPRTLINHQKCHTGLKPYKCDYCDKRFTHKKPLQYHMKTHTGDRPHICDICGKTYIQPYNLVVHKRAHSDERPFVCNECGKSFTSRGTLRLHMTIHTGVKNFVCTVCGKAFARSSELTIHMRLHSGERPYQCDMCNKSFIKRSNLQIHRTTHTGEKKFMCSVCGHRVAYLCRLKIHMKQHVGLKTFKCTLCNKDCTSRADLRTHIQMHSAKKTELITAEENVKCPTKKCDYTIDKITSNLDAEAVKTNRSAD